MNSIALTRSITPPGGHFCPAKQDSVYEADSFNIQDLPAKAQQSLPNGFTVLEISAGNIYGWSGTGWEDEINGGPVSSTSITGTVHFRNPATYDVEFVW